MFFLHACALLPPEKPAHTVKKHLAGAQAAATKADGDSVRIYVDSALDFPGEEKQVKQFLHANPAIAAMYVELWDARIKGIKSAAYVPVAGSRIDLMKTHEILPDVNLKMLRAALIDKARQGNLDGSIPFTLKNRAQRNCTQQSEAMKARDYRRGGARPPLRRAFFAPGLIA